MIDIQKEIYNIQSSYYRTAELIPRYLAISNHKHAKLVESLLPQFRTFTINPFAMLDEYRGMKILLVTNKGDDFVEVLS